MDTEDLDKKNEQPANEVPEGDKKPDKTPNPVQPSGEGEGGEGGDQKGNEGDTKPDEKPEEQNPADEANEDDSIVGMFLKGEVDKAREMIQKLTIEKTKELLK